MMYETDITHLYKDGNSGALINKNISELQRYKINKKTYSDIKKILQRLELLEKKLDMLCNTEEDQA